MTESQQPLWHNRSFFRLWAAQFSSMMAVYSLILAGIVLVEDRTQSSVGTGLVILASVVPAFLGSFIAGAVVDRLGALRVLRASHLARVVLALAFWAATSVLPASFTLPAILMLNLLAVSCTQFAAPAEMALLPELIDETRLVSVNGLFQISLLASQGLGMIVLSPLLIKLAGVPTVGVSGALLCLVALGLVTIRPLTQNTCIPRAEGRASPAALLSDVKVGWRVIVEDRMLALVTVQVTLAGVLLFVLLSLVPGLASRHLGLKAEDVPFLLLPGGVGFVLGILLLDRREGRLSRLGWIALGLSGLGAAIGLLGLLSSQGGPVRLWLFRGLTLSLGLALAFVLLPARAVLQEHPPPHVRGRVIAAQLTLANLSAVIPLLLAGFLADWLGIRPVLGLLSLLTMGAGALGWYNLRS